MKDATHHLRNVQKKVIQSTRKETKPIVLASAKVKASTPELKVVVAKGEKNPNHKKINHTRRLPRMMGPSLIH